MQKNSEGSRKNNQRRSFLKTGENYFQVMMHVNNIKHQHAAVNHIKEHLSLEEVLIHVDFSENYGCKYGKEIQSAHFGG